MEQEKDIVEQLKHAGELWFDVDSCEMVPVERKHGKWLFKTAADEIERLRAQCDYLRVKLNAVKGEREKVARLGQERGSGYDELTAEAAYQRLSSK